MQSQVPRMRKLDRRCPHLPERALDVLTNSHDVVAVFVISAADHPIQHVVERLWRR